MSTEKVLSFFKDITRVPRESGHEEKIKDFLCKFAADRGLECRSDEVGNVLIAAPASAGMENLPVVVLQAHQDMVCEKNAGVDHDFSKDPIKYDIEDGWMVAKDTTLGADCGIGIAAALAVLDGDVRHGKIEALFTTSEETALVGANGIKPGFFTGQILINLDSEDEGQIFIGCAGGADTLAAFPFSFKAMPEGAVASKFGLRGCIGGHSGDDIDKGRANPVQLIARFADKAVEEERAELCFIEGGNRHNALAREAYVVLAFPQAKEDRVVSLFNSVVRDIKNEYALTDPQVDGYAEPAVWNKSVVDIRAAKALLRSLLACPHGVLAMSRVVPGMVETSTNLASVRTDRENKRFRVATMQRSNVNSSTGYASERVAACFKLAGAKTMVSDGYPGWEPKGDSEILKVAVASYKRLFGTDPKVLTIHAGLECGLFTEKYPGLDMISIGPTLRGVHAPGEKLDLASLDKFWDLLKDILLHV